MTWNPFKKEETPVPDPEKKPDEKPGEKPISEVIAEAIAGALRPVVEGQAALKTEIEGMKRPAKPTTPTEVSRTSVFDDEDKAFAERITPVVEQNLLLSANMEKDKVRREYEDLGFGDAWKQYSSEINTAIDSAALWTQSADGPKILRGDPAYIRNCADMVIGRHAREGGIKFNGASKSFFLESGGGGEGGNRNAPPTDGLNEKQRKVMERMGIGVDDRKKVMSKLEFVS